MPRNYATKGVADKENIVAAMPKLFGRGEGASISLMVRWVRIRNSPLMIARPENPAKTLRFVLFVVNYDPRQRI